MIRNPRPTRAEVADVANAIYDGTDAIMLSGETAAGKYPLEALKMMVEIAQTTEPHLNYEDYTHNRNMCGESRVSSAVGLAAVQTARDLKAKAIVTPTFGGRTAILISNFRPEAPIYAVTPNDTILHRLQLVWGVTPRCPQKAACKERRPDRIYGWRSGYQYDPGRCCNKYAACD